MCDHMESDKALDSYGDSRDQSRKSHQSLSKDSKPSSSRKNQNSLQDRIHNEDEKNSSCNSKSKTRRWDSDPDRDHVSDEEERRSDGSYYSDDYDRESLSERSLSSFSRSRTPSPALQQGMRAKQAPRNAHRKAGGAGRWGVSRPAGLSLTQQHHRGTRSLSKDSSPPKDLDLVTKRMLSARLLKINELRNALTELQQSMEDLKKENRVLKQLQARQEKALRRYDDTESEISLLLARHSNETHVLRERLRRTQERERVAEQRLKDAEEQLQKRRATIVRLKKLVDQRELGTRDELSRRLDEEKMKTQEAQQRIKDLERNLELTNSSFQRQIAVEKKKTVSAQEEVRSLQEELQRLTNKLKEKERDLDTKNIYANRMAKASKKDSEGGTKRKIPGSGSSKGVQTDDRLSSLDFPTPPPAICDANEISHQPLGEYISLQVSALHSYPFLELSPFCLINSFCQQEVDRSDRQTTQKTERTGKEKHLDFKIKLDPGVPEEKPKRLREGLEKEKEEEEKRTTADLGVNQKEGGALWKHGHVQEEVARWNQESMSNQQAADEVRRKKEQLLAKMREIDQENLGAPDSRVDESSVLLNKKSSSDQTSPRPLVQRQKNSSTEPEETGRFLAGIREGGRRRPGLESGAITAPHTQTPTDELAFGGYAPSFGHSTARASFGFPPPPPDLDRSSALESICVFSLKRSETEKDKDTDKKVVKDKKSHLMQQLFGSTVDSLSPPSKPELLSSPPPTNGVHSRRERLINFSSGSPTHQASVNSLRVEESRPAVRAIPSFDDDLEELAL
ncbi:Lebercilin [Oryzias melastigma]|uniref:Lebercilin n=1 Tax=Oryzias melastigma TaxID=30732 RepID=A0A834BRP6_ORYME|nr:Lebercilin [Oryzias melastigma]